MIELTDKQNEALDLIASEKYNFFLFGGAMGGGKSYWALTTLLIMCEIFPKSRWLVIRENLEKIRTTTIPSFKKLNPTGNMISSPYEYTHHNGSQILFKGENYDNDKDLDWLKGFEASGILFEEINECQEKTFNMAFARIGRWESNPRPKPIILATCNPTTNWVKTRIYDRWKENELPSNWYYLPSKVTDNPFLTEDYLESLKNMPPYEYEVFVNGNWDIPQRTGMEFYKYFDINKHLTTIAYDETKPLHLSIDENVQPYFPATLWQIEGKKAVCIDEFVMKNPYNNVAGMTREFKTRYPNHVSGLFIYGDATSQKEDVKVEKGYNLFDLVIRELRDYHPNKRIPKANPSVVMRGNFINQIFWNNIQGIQILINENCKSMIADLMNGKEAADGTKDKKTKNGVQEYHHLNDSLDYVIIKAFEREYLEYQRGGNRDFNYSINKHSISEQHLY